MARPYKYAVEWIALNDEPTDMDPASVADMISTMLVADIYRKDPAEVARDIVEFRESEAG